jgi:hypothetical protein
MAAAETWRQCDAVIIGCDVLTEPRQCPAVTESMFETMETAMSKTLEMLEAEVLNLTGVERSHLLDRLITSLETDGELQAAWLEEAARRDAEFETASVAGVPGESSLARLRANLG